MTGHIEAVLASLRATLPAERVMTDAADCLAYGYDNSRRCAAPQAVVVALNAEDVALTVRACREHAVPLTVRGRGTNTTGASVPVAGGVVLTLERMNRVIEYRPADRLMVVEPGVLNAEVQRIAEADGLFWAPDPTSAAYSTVGGNLACGAGGPRAVKYGTARDAVLGLRAVTGNGDLIRSGGETTKGVVGYDLTRLLIGSEGTLAVITEATLKLLPRPTERRMLRACYVDTTAAIAAVVRLMGQADLPCAVEFMDGAAVALAQAWRDTGVPAATGALLLIEVDGSAASVSLTQQAVAAAAAAGDGVVAVDVAETAAHAEALWACRKALSPSLRKLAPKKVNEDVAVPVSRLPLLLAEVEAIAASGGLQIVNFGHAGNGNIHVNILADPDDPAQMSAITPALSRLFRKVLELGGTLSGEHGVGIDKREFVSWEIDAVTLALMHSLKRVFDPAGILNPGKTLPGP